MTSELELRQLRTFIAVIEAGTLTRAAQVLGVAQSTVSESVASLERALGARVFERAGRSLGLTGEGRALVPWARKMLALERETRAGLAAAGGRAKSTLLVGAVESVSTYLLPPITTALRQAWPRLRIDVEMGVCADVRRWADEGRVDVGLLFDSASGRQTDGRLNLHTPLTVFRRPLEEGDEAQGLDVLRRGTFFFSDRAGLYHQLLREHFRAAGLPAPAMIGLGTIEAVKRTVSRLAGAYGVLPQFALSEELESGSLAAVELRPALRSLELKVLRAGRQLAPPAVRELLALIGQTAPRLAA